MATNAKPSQMSEHYNRFPHLYPKTRASKYSDMFTPTAVNTGVNNRCWVQKEEGQQNTTGFSIVNLFLWFGRNFHDFPVRY